MSSLRRTMAAGFTLEDAVTMEEVQEKGGAVLLPTDSLFTQYPILPLTSAGKEKRVRSGGSITDPSVPDGAYRIYGQDKTFLCLSQAKGGELRSVKNFF